MPLHHDNIVEHFGRIWPVHVEGFTELLIVLRKFFGGDLDRMLVLAIIGSRTLPLRQSQGLTYEAFMQQLPHESKPAPINVQSIAECSGIPRETVRRKIRELEQAGWIRKLDNGHLVASEQAARDLAPMTEASLKYLAAIGSVFVEAVSSQKPEIGPEL